MPTQLITRITDGPFVETVKGSPLVNPEIDGNFITLAENKLERSNNLSDITSPLDARANLDVPSLDGNGAFGTWSISVTGNSGTATTLQNSRKINGVGFDGSANITITAATDGSLIFGNGLTSSSDFDGSTTQTVNIDTAVVVATTGNQVIDGTKTFNSALEVETQATAANHAVVGSRTISTGTGITGGGNLTNDLTLEIDSTDVVVTSDTDQTIDGSKTFSDALNLSVEGTQVTHAVRADREVATGDGLEGGGDLTSNLTLSVDNSVIRTTGNQTLSGVKTFTSPPVLSSPSTSITEAVRSDREISSGDGLNGGGNLTSNLSLSVDNTVIRTTGNQTLGGTKTFISPVILSTQGATATEALAAGRSITAGDGLTGGGNLTTDRAFAVDNTVARTSRAINTGDGLNGGGDLTQNRTISLDNTVVRTTGTQIVGGSKTFSSATTFSNDLTVSGTLSAQGTSTFDNPIILPANQGGTTEAVRADRAITAGDGITGGGDLTNNLSFSVDDTVVRTTGNQTIAGEITFPDPILLGSAGDSVNEPVRADREIIVGDGIAGGGNLTSDLILTVDNTVARTSTRVVADDGIIGGGFLSSDITLSVGPSVTRNVSVPIRSIFIFTVGDIISSDSNPEFTQSDYTVDSDYDDLIIGETVIGLISGATGVVQAIDVLTDSVVVTALEIQGTFETEGEIIQGQSSGAEVEIESYEIESFTTQDIRASGEVIDYIPTDANNVENVTDIPNALDKVLAIGGKLFDWTDAHIDRRRSPFETDSDDVGEDGYFIQKSDFGVIAQDVQEVFPQGVREKENGELAVDYRKLFALSFAAIKELNDKIV